MFKYIKNLFKSDYEKQIELRKDFLQMKFEAKYVNREDLFAFGKVVGEDRYYLSFLAAESPFAQTSIYFEISKEEFDVFIEDVEKIKPLLKRCKERKEDHRLFDKNGKNEWIAL